MISNWTGRSIQGVPLALRHSRRNSTSILPREEVLLITRGDRLSQDDAAVSSSELLGRVTSILRAQTVMTPSIGTTVKGRMLAAISRYSEWPVQVLLHLYSLRHKNATTNFSWDEQKQEVS